MDKRLICILMILVLSGCDTGSNFAPVTDISGIEPIPSVGIHRVKHGESLYEIAWRYGMDYRLLAKRNRMTSPYYIHSGQIIYLRGTSPLQLPQADKNRTMPLPLTTSEPYVGQNSSPVLKQNKPLSTAVAGKPEMEPNYSVTSWIWPARGKIINTFSSFNKGINIAGNQGEPIRAAAAGKVVYSGDGLRGYGKLIIIKHNSLYLSAYAHNRVIVVKEGDWVQQGQKIAEMGKTGSDKVMLHFEIRRAGKPIDPAALL